MAITIDFQRRQVELILSALTDKAASLESDAKRLAATDNKRANQCQSDYFAVMEMVECMTAGLAYGDMQKRIQDPRG